MGADLEGVRVRQVAAGLNLTVALTTDGRVYQMGDMGLQAKAPWEGCSLPTQVCVALLELPVNKSEGQFWIASAIKFLGYIHIVYRPFT